MTKPMTPEEAGEVAEALIVTYLGHVAPPEVLAVSPRMPARALAMLHSKALLAQAELMGTEHALLMLDAMRMQLVERYVKEQAAVDEAARKANEGKPRIVQPMPPRVQ